MKKYVKLFLLILCAFLVVGCAKDEKDDSKKEEKTVKEVAIEETVLHDSDEVKITAKSISFSKRKGMELKLEIENNMDDDLAFMLEYFKINDIVVDAALYSEISSGKTANDSIYLDSEYLEFAGIEQIKDIEFVVYGSDSNYDDVFVSKVLTLSTNVEDYEQEIDKDGDEVVNQNGITIISMDSEENDFGPYVKLYIENTLDKEVYISFDDVSVNGIMIDPYFYVELPANTKKYAMLSFDTEDLEDNDIDDMETIVFDVDAYDKSYDYILNLNDLVIEVK